MELFSLREMSYLFGFWKSQTFPFSIEKRACQGGVALSFANRKTLFAPTQMKNRYETLHYYITLSYLVDRLLKVTRGGLFEILRGQTDKKTKARRVESLENNGIGRRVEWSRADRKRHNTTRRGRGASMIAQRRTGGDEKMLWRGRVVT